MKLTFENAQVAKSTGGQEHPKQVPTSPGELVASPGELVQLLQGDQEPYLGQLVQEGPHVVMFLSLQLDSDTAKDEVCILQGTHCSPCVAGAAGGWEKAPELGLISLKL